MALQEAAVYHSSIFSHFAQKRRRAKWFMASSQAVFSLRAKFAQNTWWTETATTPACLGWRRRNRAFYMKTRDSSLSFPTPKLGAKTRTC